ncbi:hypothetical protein, partial [Aeromonas caviae]|uniref:hypothetical protein n=1 Tax=Aeromonas caviae TaxID=648 RepID=UPI001CC61A3F
KPPPRLTFAFIFHVLRVVLDAYQVAAHQHQQSQAVGKEATHTKNAERVGGNMAGNDPRELSREFSAVRQLR